MALTLTVGGQIVGLSLVTPSVALTVGENTIALTATAATVGVQTYIPGADGTHGVTGPAGDSGFTIPTNSPIGGNRAIATVSGYAAYADSSDTSKVSVGISMGAVVSGVDVSLQTGSKMTVSGAGWTPDAPVYVSINGTLTQTEPASGFSQALGVAHDSETLLIEIQKPVILA